MKKHAFLSLVLLALTASPALATPGTARGQAVLPRFHSYYSASNNAGSTKIFVSNITDADVTVTIKLFTYDGTLVQDGDNSATAGPIRGQLSFANYQDAPTGASATFTLGAHQTGNFRVIASSSQPQFTGYAIISWEQTGSAAVALVATAEIAGTFTPSGYGWAHMYSEQVNGGLPF